MDWFLFAFVASGLWTVVALIDKSVLERFIPTPSTYLVISASSSIIPIVGMPFFLEGLFELNLAVVVAAASGTLYTTYNYFFFRSLELEDTSVVINIWLLVPILSSLWGALFFSEILSGWAYLGIITAVLGLMFTQRTANGGTNGGSLLSKGAQLMALSAVIASVEYSIVDAVVKYIPPYQAFYASRYGVFLGLVIVLIAFPRVREAVKETVRSATGKVIGLSSFNETLDLLATYLLTLSYSRGPLGGVATVAATQPALVFLVTLFVNRARPGLIPSTGDEKYALLRFLGIALTFVGVSITIINA